MMPAAHYGHHQFNPAADTPWMHQQTSAHHQHAHAQQAAANAAANAVREQSQSQQQYGRGQSQDGPHENISEDNRRTMAYIADLLNESTRESALLELSKKREQVPELALILWHSFGACNDQSVEGELRYTDQKQVS